MDIKATAEKLFEQISGDSKLLSSFKKKPEDTVKSLIKTEVGNDIIKKIVEIIKAKLGLDDVAGIASKIGGLFGKK